MSYYQSISKFQSPNSSPYFQYLLLMRFPTILLPIFSSILIVSIYLHPTYYSNMLSAFQASISPYPLAYLLSTLLMLLTFWHLLHLFILCLPFSPINIYSLQSILRLNPTISYIFQFFFCFGVTPINNSWSHFLLFFFRQTIKMYLFTM